jgi:hypothetical protein
MPLNNVHLRSKRSSTHEVREDIENEHAQHGTLQPSQKINRRCVRENSDDEVQNRGNQSLTYTTCCNHNGSPTLQRRERWLHDERSLLHPLMLNFSNKIFPPGGKKSEATGIHSQHSSSASVIRPYAIQSSSTHGLSTRRSHCLRSWIDLHVNLDTVKLDCWFLN